MRFLFADFDGVLGVQGEVVFPQNQPLVLYGENVSGKSNIINALRYCLNPPLGPRKSTYSEDKMPAKDEMLVEPLEEGSVTIYFVQGDELFKLEYRFSRGSSGVNRREALYITEGDPPVEDVSQGLRDVEWGSRDETGVTAIKEKLEEKKVYPEILDVLIAPSNIANFSEAVSGDIIDVPELIEQEVEQRRKRSEWYEGKLDSLKNVCENQHQQLSAELDDLREEFLDFDFEAAGLSQETAENKFDAGADGLREFKETVSEKQGELPDVQQQVTEISNLVEDVQGQNELVGEVEEALGDSENLKGWVKEKPRLEDAEETVKSWKDKLENLPGEENIEGITSFSSLDTEDFDFDLLENGDEIADRLGDLSTIQEKIEEAEEIREDHNIPKGRLEKRKKELQRLITSLDDPVKEPEGVDSVLFVEGDQATVGVPESEVDTLQETPSYTEVSSTPRVVETGGESSESVGEYRDEMNRDLQDVEEAIEARDKAQELLQEFREEVPGMLEEEKKSLHRKVNYRERNIEETKKDWNTAYSNLCSEFDEIDEEDLGFDGVEEVRQSESRLEEAVGKAKSLIRENLEDELSGFDDISVPEEISEESLNQLVEELERKQDELEKAEEVLDGLESWIDKNLSEVEEISEKLETAQVSKDVAAIGSLVFHEVKQKSDITEIVDQLAESIENNVRATYDHIFAGESLEFSHEGGGEFRCTLNGNEITHPSGSQRAVISFGIMLSLAKSFDLPILLDEAADRFDYTRLAQFFDFITGITADQGIQTCLVMCKSKDIEDHAEVREQLSESDIYQLQRVNEIENQVQPADLDAITATQSSQ